VVRARDIADRRGGGKTFMRLIQQQGLARVVNKATASRLLRIMEHLPQVTAWHETLTDKQQIEWAAPTTILKHCPVFAEPKPDKTERPMTKAEQDRQALAVALEENERLKRKDGDTFDAAKDTPRNIALALFGQLEPYPGKAKRVLAELTKIVEAAEPAAKTPSGALPWKVNTKLGVSSSGGHQYHEAKVEGGSYVLGVTLDVLNGMRFSGYAVEFRPTGAKIADYQRIKNAPTLEKAKAVAERHYAGGKP
jgi:hypothetical protein